MCLSLLKSTLVTNCEDHLLKAKYHLMETTYLTMQVVGNLNDSSLSIAFITGLHFCNNFFTDDFQVCCYTVYMKSVRRRYRVHARYVCKFSVVTLKM